MLKLQSKDQPTHSMWMVGDSFSIGSDDCNDFVINDQAVAPVHLKLLISSETVVVSQHSAATFLNGEPVTAGTQLQPANELQVAGHRLSVLSPQMVSKQQAAVNTVSELKEVHSPLWRLQTSQLSGIDSQLCISDKAILGRSKDCDLAIAHKWLSRQHAQFHLHNDQLLMRDLGSANGSFVNGQRVESALLKHGDELTFCHLKLTVIAAATSLDSD